MSERSESTASGELREAVRTLLRPRIAPAAEPLEAMTAPAFRSVVADRLRTLERDVAEVRSRVNGLLFVVAGAVVTQLVLRLFG